ncbi:protein HIDE1 isoform X1 [Python bivittatus]|uniref:Protein HIDE1 isoform X1 n=1 Tax=Python bivittatus TaxID=176946 RepID=A0A9F5J2K8_PYTBI|nr:protein HIDE1 isoform X1 [Python bivittatus]
MGFFFSFSKRLPVNNSSGGCVASFSRFPSPLIFLDVLSDNVTEGDSLKIACIAPRKYVDAWFFLFKENKSKALKSLPAAESQHTVTFLLENVTTGDGGRYRCQYGLYNGSQLQESEFSHVLEITVKAPACLTACLPDCLPACLNLFATSSPSDPPKYDSKGAASVLPTALSVTGVLLLVLILFAAVGTTGYLKRRRKKKRELNSCWAEASYPTTETSFDSTMFTVSEKSNQEIKPTVENSGASISSATGPRLVSRTSLEKPDFSTFRASE